MQPVRYGYTASISLHRSQARPSAHRGHLLGRKSQWCMYRSNSKAPWRYAPRYACWGKDVIVPFPKAALNTPAIAVDMVAGPEKRQLSAQAPHIIILTCVELKLGHPCKYLFFDAANRAARRIKDSQAMPPGKLTLDHKQGIPIFIVNIIAVEPGEHPLLEKHLHCVTSLHLPVQYLLPASHLLALCLL